MIVYIKINLVSAKHGIKISAGMNNFNQIH